LAPTIRPSPVCPVAADRAIIPLESLAKSHDELTAASVDFVPVDEDDVYSKYEAAPPDWFWIEH